MKLKMALLHCLLAATAVTAQTEDFAALCDDRVAVERIYYSHLLGNKPPFDQTAPRSMIENLVKEDLHKQAVLRQTYGVELTSALVEAETERIDATSRAPGTLAEIKAALGGDPNRFARAVVKPLLAERLLRHKFENDAALHAAQRTEVEKVRDRMLAAKKDRPTITALLALLKEGHSNETFETTWLLGPPPIATNTPNSDDTDPKKLYGPSARMTTPPRDVEQRLYFEDLPPPLKEVLRVQLRQTGDVSAVIEVSRGFLLYLETAKAPDSLGLAVLFIPKRDYQDWLNKQP